MAKKSLVTSLLLFLLCATSAIADDFTRSLRLDPIRRMALQNQQTVKTFDTYARDTLWTITNSSSLDDRPAAEVVLDMAYNPASYVERPLIYIRNKPFRQDFRKIEFLTPSEVDAIIKTGRISLAMWRDPRVRSTMEQIFASDVKKGDAINKIDNQAAMLQQMLGDGDGTNVDAFLRLSFLPPLQAPSANATQWNSVAQVIQASRSQPLAYTTEQMLPIASAALDLQKGWIARNADQVNAAARKISDAVEKINPEVYPSSSKRSFELIYNRFARLTLPGAAIYFFAFVGFLIAWQTQINWLRRASTVLIVLGWLIHLAAIAIRWWLVSTSIGGWFNAIPIKNLYEAILMSAFLGGGVVLALELRKRNSIFGAVTAFCGWLSMLALFATPYVTGVEIGGQIGQVQGILLTYWLYIHVTLVTASYALIAMTFALGIWWLLARLGGAEGQRLQLLDQCNLVILQLAFWTLGVGIIMGAVWADVSWGRPWGWDPKETFALVTWIVYMIIIHVRLFTSRNRAMLTAVLSIVGFGIMLFNWIGVNFFLVGLHSYA